MRKTSLLYSDQALDQAARRGCGASLTRDIPGLS